MFQKIKILLFILRNMIELIAEHQGTIKEQFQFYYLNTVFTCLRMFFCNPCYFVAFSQSFWYFSKSSCSFKFIKKCFWHSFKSIIDFKFSTEAHTLSILEDWIAGCIHKNCQWPPTYTKLKNEFSCLLLGRLARVRYHFKCFLKCYNLDMLFRSEFHLSSFRIIKIPEFNRINNKSGIIINSKINIDHRPCWWQFW